MKKILIISFYGSKNHFINIAHHFELYNYTVLIYPLFRYAYDKHDKIKDYDQHLSDYIKNNNIDVVLWWFVDVPLHVFNLVKKYNPSVYYILNNSDDPLNFNADILEKSKIFNLIMIPCKENILKYKAYTNSEVTFMPYCYDSNVFFPLDSGAQPTDRIFECDVSFLCHNLFDDKHYKDQYINKIDLINDVIKYGKKNNKIIKIFGPEIFKQIFPKNYQCNVEYTKLNMLFNYSKINITTHAIQNKSCYINEYVMSILGSGGLLMMDDVKDIKNVISENECIYLDKYKYVKQIDEILLNYDKYSIIKKNGYELSKKYTWEVYVDKIHTSLCKSQFDEKVYMAVHNITDLKNHKNLWEYWLAEGKKNNHICHKFNIPANFQSEEYAQKNNLSDKSLEYLYYHWLINDKNEIYTQKKNTTNLKLDDTFVVMEDFFELCTIFNNLSIHSNTLNNLNNLQKFVECHPGVKINNLLDSYLKMI